MKCASNFIIQSLYQYKLLDNVIIFDNVKVYFRLYLKNKKLCQKMKLI
jgi:hypothetical protein